MPAEMAWGFFKTATLGLVASFVLHESAHAIALKRLQTITHIAVDRSAWRTSVVPIGTMTARQMAGVALVGPMSCAGVGALLWLSGLNRPLAWWHLAHVVFLLPFFGDGRALCTALRTAKVTAPTKSLSD
ncbi:hypothetical protein ACFZAV_03065 [Streptomyces sp. NPDC008343]|uniref:hypothetical protein n=1 Tax=Streptomyces sp. NPDC008343 TaxID=3364828 RepID=UPI0036E60288